MSPIRSRAALAMPLLACLLVLPGCATTGATDIPADAVPVTQRQSNGDVVTEYRVGGQLRVVKVEPSRGPTYYLYDRDGDGIPDKTGDNPPQTYFKLFGWK